MYILRPLAVIGVFAVSSQSSSVPLQLQLLQPLAPLVRGLQTLQLG